MKSTFGDSPNIFLFLQCTVKVDINSSNVSVEKVTVVSSKNELERDGERR